MNSVLIFDLNGNRVGSLPPNPADILDGPSALARQMGELCCEYASIESLSLIYNRIGVISCMIVMV